jgi:hypothetical protein
MFTLGSFLRRANFRPTFFHGTSFTYIEFDKEYVGLHYGRFVSQTQLVTLLGGPYRWTLFQTLNYYVSW